MGGFATITGLAEAPADSLKRALKEYAAEHGGVFTRDGNPFGSPETINIVSNRSRRASLLSYANLEQSGQLTKWLSRALDSPAFLFHIHDGDLWMYWLFAGGKERDRFNPIPDYFPVPISDRELKRCAGSARTVARHWPGITAAEVDRYLKRWNLDDPAPGKAFPDDLHEFNDCMQLIDFMRRLGLVFPFDDDGQPTGKNYRLHLSTKSQRSKRTRNA